MNNKALFEALRSLEQEKGISMDAMITQISKAIVIACKNNYGGNDDVEISMVPEKNSFDVKLNKEVVEEFSEVLYTLREVEVAGWLRSLQLRGINLPDALKDEAFLIIGERRTH